MAEPLNSPRRRGEPSVRHELSGRCNQPQRPSASQCNVHASAHVIKISKPATNPVSRPRRPIGPRRARGGGTIARRCGATGAQTCRRAGGNAEPALPTAACISSAPQNNCHTRTDRAVVRPGWGSAILAQCFNAGLRSPQFAQAPAGRKNPRESLSPRHVGARHARGARAAFY